MKLSSCRASANRRRAQVLSTLMMIATMLLLSFIAPARVQSAPPPAVDVKAISADKLANVPGSTLTAVLVTLPPGAKVPPHHHAGFVFAYVLSGTVRSQLNRGKIADYAAGQSWVEPPGTEHTLTANPGATTATLLAVFVAPDGATLTTSNK